MSKMDLSLVLLVAIGLAMDCFAVSLAAGTTISSAKTRAALIIAACFGGFQAMMALLGWLAGTWLAPVIASFDHWAAFIILSLIGGKMIVEGFSGEEEQRRDHTRGSRDRSCQPALCIRRSYGRWPSRFPVWKTGGDSRRNYPDSYRDSHHCRTPARLNPKSASGRSGQLLFPFRNGAILNLPAPGGQGFWF
jgi:hypothetical protein